MIIIACSQKKSLDKKDLPAEKRYHGTIFRYAVRYAQLKGLDIFILSAKYGLISKDILIPYYDEKMTKEKAKRFKPGIVEALNIIRNDSKKEIYCVGGEVYRLALPEYVIPLVVGNRSEMTTGLLSLLYSFHNGPLNIDKVSNTLHLAPIGITGVIYTCLVKGWHTKEEIYQEIVAAFGETPLSRRTIDAQLTRTRMPKERGFTLERDGKHYRARFDDISEVCE